MVSENEKSSARKNRPRKAICIQLILANSTGIREFYHRIYHEHHQWAGNSHSSTFSLINIQLTGKYNLENHIPGRFFSDIQPAYRRTAYDLWHFLFGTKLIEGRFPLPLFQSVPCTQMDTKLKDGRFPLLCFGRTPKQSIGEVKR